MPCVKWLKNGFKRLGGDVLLGLCWLLALVGGVAAMTRYEVTPGAASELAGDWPVESPFPPSGDAWTLVMCLHPQCPCSRASLHELGALLRECDTPVTTQLVFLQPEDPDQSAEWRQSPLWDAARALPNVSLHADPGGVVTQLFGARTSGAVFLFDAQQRLRYSGGVTGARGHVGENAGRAQLLACFTHNDFQSATHSSNDTPSSPDSCPVYGCPLRHSEKPALGVSE